MRQRADMNVDMNSSQGRRLSRPISSPPRVCLPTVSKCCIQVVVVLLFFFSLLPHSLDPVLVLPFLLLLFLSMFPTLTVCLEERESRHCRRFLVCAPAAAALAAMIVPLLTSLIIIGSSTRHPNNMLPLSPSEPFIRQSRRLISYSLPVNLCVPRAHTRSLAQTRKQLFPAYPSAAEVCIFYTHSILVLL